MKAMHKQLWGYLLITLIACGIHAFTGTNGFG